MSSNKRQKIEEYHDPDYCQDEAKSKTSDSERMEKIKMIIKREFLKEINSKEEEINLIDHKLTQTKRLLQRVRYAVAMSYYTKKNLVHSANELKCETNTSEGIGLNIGQQTAIHPSLKKLLGKKPIDYEEILKSRSPRNAAKTARSTLIKPIKKEKIKSDNDIGIEVKIPRYVSPTKPNVQIEKINSSRGRNQTNHLIVVGNTSKYIGDEKSANEVTHKWLVYIKTKTAVSIEAMVSKARFFLHPSYKPNDVIEVDSPPFQISRRGWGEFPIRVQLYFHESVNQKPLQIYHNLILDKKMTGLQTMGAETVVEVWLDLPISNSVHESEKKYLPSSSKKESLKRPPDELFRQDLFSKIDKQATTSPPINIKIEEPLIIMDTPQTESVEVIPENNNESSKMNVSTTDSHPDVFNTSKNSAEGFLNDISEIFKDTAPAKTKTVDKVDTVKSKPVQQKKTLVRCLDNNGKIVFVELQVDPNNPKNIKIVKTPTVISSTQSAATSLFKSQNVTQSKPIAQIEPTTRTTPVPVSNILSNTLNSPNPNVDAKSLTSIRSTINAKQIMVEGNTSLPRISTVEAKNLLENKKIFILKSSTLPNLNSTNPPPLVRISNPTKISVAPSTANLKIVQPTSKPTEPRKLTFNSNKVIMKNGQIIIIDKDKSLPKPKQESLLKPQISLLKPLYQKQTNESTMTKAISTQKPPCNSLGSRLRKPIPSNLQGVKRDYYKEFYTVFLRHRFQTVRSAVEYILRNVPLFNTLSSRTDFNAAFPFVAESNDKFNSFPFAKRRSNEWYRAKFVIRMLQQHPDLKNQSFWLPKEVIIFGRRFGFTPTYAVENLANNQLQNNQSPFKAMIKQHIKEEQLRNITITFNDKINDFIQRYDDLTQTYSITPISPLDIVDVDGDDESQEIKIKLEPTQVTDNQLALDVNKIMQSGGTLVNDICHDIQIKLHQEEIVDGVLCSSSQLLLYQAMRSFMEDLIRRSFATKPVTEQISDLSAERCVRVDDLKKAITVTEHFSFLTNKYLGKRSNS